MIRLSLANDGIWMVFSDSTCDGRPSWDPAGFTNDVCFTSLYGAGVAAKFRCDPDNKGAHMEIFNDEACTQHHADYSLDATMPCEHKAEILGDTGFRISCGADQLAKMVQFVNESIISV